MSETQGLLAPATPSDVEDAYVDVGPVAQTVTREVAKAMAFDKAEYDERVTSDVVETARDALFAGLLEVETGTTAEFEAWRDAHDDYEVEWNGSEDVDGVAWHVVPFEDTVVAASYQNEADAAVSTLRRIAFGKYYRPVL
ncbi:DUF5809 family protein [Halocalculus aciditolerans]|uniref:Uncharacterized protein n=1 Tax=Halocalculus aciditolerans TaxID=1383812 RepID=A0A830FLZ1_9EURY|nr:DUF5809 family protein [Halocalculus aciditolerans]GGL68856.1 hypothetical protein GCM10009039_28550 [Halocalculus aciditolerans]